jgi:multidrug efflux pump subunit AcrB
MSRVARVEDFNDIIIATKNNYPIRLRDLGRVEDGGVDPARFRV